MFVIPTKVGFTYRVVAMLVACAVALWSIGVYSTAEAAQLNDVSNTLTDSDVDATSGHDIRFTVPAGSSIGSGDTVSITFPTEFGGTGGTEVADSVIGDITVEVDGTPAAPGNFDSTGQVISFDSITAAAGNEVSVVIDAGVIDNPDNPGSYEFFIDTGTDTGRTRVAILDNVVVTAEVDTFFEFTVTGLATSTAVNGTSTTGSTTATAIPFGTLVAGEIKTMAQQLNVTTNAGSGYVVTVEQDQNLLSANGADIDAFIDGSYEDTPTSWANPSNTLLDEDTWGHWGLTTSDNNLQGNGTNFAADEWIAASTTPRAIMAHNDPSDGTTGTDTAGTGVADTANDDVGQTIIGYQIEITPLQEAADDYETTLTYIATPTF